MEMNPRFPKKNRRGQFEAGPSFIARNDPFFQRSISFLERGGSNRDTGPGAVQVKKNTRWYDKEGRQPKGNHQPFSSSNSASSESSSLRLTESAKFKNYICPNCKHPYNYIISNNTLTGKVPRILPCKHTVCEECIKKCIKSTNQIQCIKCTKTEFDKKQFYEYNHYVLGQLTCTRFNKAVIDFSNIALTSADSRNQSLENNKIASIPPKEKCGFKTCINPGTISCKDCCGVYCTSCDDLLHKSGKQLLSHKRVPLKSVPLELQRCPDHSMDEELYCNDCGKSCCCYCILDKHEGHSRSFLNRLNDEEEAALMDAYGKAKLKKQQLMVSSWKISKMEGTNTVSDLELEIAQQFADIHAQLHFLEKRLYEEAKLVQNSNFNLVDLNKTIQSNIETLDTLINGVEERENVKFNMKMLLNKLKDMEDLPSVLVSSESSGKPKLVIDQSINDLENYFKLEIPETGTFKLMDAKELPEDYQEEEIKPANSEMEVVQSPQSRSSRFRQNCVMQDCDRFKQQAVFVTHIHSLDSFYVQLKEDDKKFQQLEQEIKNHISRTELRVAEIRMKELYLARRIGDRSTWCRVRVMEKIDTENGEKYKVKFIDFGNNALVRKEEMTYISASLASRKPFAFECRLDNPSQFQWPKGTHLELAKLIDINKELIMYTKEFSNNISTVVLSINTSAGGSCSVTELLIFGCDALRKGSPIHSPIKEETLLSNRIYENSDVFTVGNSYEVYIQYVFDPWHIYVLKTSYQTSFNNLIAQMHGHYGNSYCDVHLPIKNSFVVVHYQTKSFGQWHRAKILEVFSEKRIVNVYLVDVGKYLNVPWKDIRKLNQIFKKSECLVVCAKLADVAPLIGNDWTNADENAIREYFLKYSKRTIKMKLLVSNNDPLEIVLFEPQPNYDVNINADLVETNLALSTGRLTNTRIWLHDEESENIEESNVLFIKDDTDDEETDTELHGIIQQVEMIQFDDPSTFYVSFVSKKADVEKLHEEMQIHYKTQKHQHIDRNWEKNEKVVVFDERDKMYYRGIIHIIEGNRYFVQFLDKVGFIWVDSGKLRLILDYFVIEFPNSVFKCHLVNIKPAGDSNKWSNLSLEWFERLFKKRSDIFIKKIAHDESKLSMPVNIWYSKLIQGSALEPSYRKYISIEKKAVEAGLAFWAPNMIVCSRPEEPEPSTSKQQDSVLVNEENDHKLSGSETSDSDATIVPKVSREIKKTNISEWLNPPDFNRKEFFAYITCAETEGYLFIREENMQVHYNEMQKKMKEHFDTIPNSPFTLRNNQMVTVRSEGLWYRAVVLSVIDKNTARILMIDFGSDHIVKMKHLRHKIMYPEIPIMVSKIKLYNIHSRNNAWTDLEVDNLIQNAPQYGKVVIRSSLCDQVPLADIYDENGVCFNDKLVELCPNLFRKQFSQKKVSKYSCEIVQEQQLKEDCDKYHENVIPNSNVDNETRQDLQEEIEQTIDQKEEEVEGDLPKESEGEVMRLKPEEVEEHSNSVVEENGTKCYSYAEMTKTTSEREVIAVYDYKTISLYHPDETSTETDFESLTKSIRENVEDQEPLENIEIGQPCLSLFEEDNLWYRAKILRVDAKQCGYVTVIYVDYGNFEVVKLSDLKTIKSEWLDFPARFVEASIDYKLLRTDQENVLLKHIQSLGGETKYIETVNNDPVLVHVYDKKNDEYELYYDVFVKNGIVQI